VADKCVWQNIDFNSTTQEWKMFFDTTLHGGPMIVFVNDKSKAVRFMVGE
jgi:hypothetical protein